MFLSWQEVTVRKGRQLLHIPAPHQGHQQHLQVTSARPQHSWTALAAQLGQPSARPAQASLSPLQLRRMKIICVAAITWSTGPTPCVISRGEPGPGHLTVKKKKIILFSCHFLCQAVSEMTTGL